MTQAKGPKPGQTFSLSGGAVKNVDKEDSVRWDEVKEPVKRAPASQYDKYAAQPNQPQPNQPVIEAPGAKGAHVKKQAMPPPLTRAAVPPPIVEPQPQAAPKAKPHQDKGPTPGAAFDDWEDKNADPLKPGKVRIKATATRRFGWVAILAFCVIALFALILVADAVSIILSLYSVNPTFGLIGLGLIGLLCASLIALIYREWRALARMSKQRELRVLSEAAIADEDVKSGEAVMPKLEAKYAQRKGSELAVTTFKQTMPASDYSAIDRLEAFERDIIQKLDEEAITIIEENARNTALITTISPFALFDALFTLWRNLRMIRQVATIYGVAPGFLGSVGLLRQVFANVMLTGGLEAADGVLNQVIGGSMAGKISTKLAEGLVNGMLSARLGLSAIDHCRPVPFEANSRPRLTTVAKRLVTSVRKAVMTGGDKGQIDDGDS